MDVRIDYFRSFLPGYGPFTGIKNIKFDKMLYLIDKHDKLYHIFMERIDFGKRPNIVLKYHTFLRYPEIA